jgi:hypothetical protein
VSTHNGYLKLLVNCLVYEIYYILVCYKSSLPYMLPPETMCKDESLDMNSPFSHKALSFNRFLHLTKYSLVSLKQRDSVMTFKIPFGFSTSLPFSSKRGNFVYIGVIRPIFFFKLETLKTSCNVPLFGISNA